MIFLIFTLCLIACTTPENNAEVDIIKNNIATLKTDFEWRTTLDKLQSKFGLDSTQLVIFVNISRQKLYLVKEENILKSYSVSTSKFEIGSQVGSNKTPQGVHRIAEKIGDGVKIGTIIKQGIITRRLAEIHTDSTDVNEDLVTTRLLWLQGLEKGLNKGKGVDSFQRRIYIHGTPEEGLIGKPASHGCIRMKNKDIVELFHLVSKGTLVDIQK